MDNADIALELIDLKYEKAIELNAEKLKPNDITHCTECGELIPKARKVAMPSAKTCVDCSL